jgi:hypothetical protein
MLVQHSVLVRNAKHMENTFFASKIPNQWNSTIGGTNMRTGFPAFHGDSRPCLPPISASVLVQASHVTNEEAVEEQLKKGPDETELELG